MEVISLKPILATAENTSEYGFYIGEKTSSERLSIPFYGHIEEGINIPFKYHKKAVLRTAKIHPTNAPIIWLERHMKLTQIFIGLGSSEYILVLGLPTHDYDTDANGAPDFRNLVAFRFAAGTGLLLNIGVWHDFPRAIDKPVSCITANSEEVIVALTSISAPREMNDGDVYKISIPDRFSKQIVLEV